MAQHIFRLESDPNSIVNGQPLTVRVFHSLENREEGDSNETGLNFSLHFDEDKLEFESAAVPTGIPGLVGANPEDDSVSNLDDDPATEKLIRWELNPLGLASGLQFPDEETEILTVNFNTQNFDDRSTINLVGEGDAFEVIETNLDIVEPSNTSPVANDDTATVGALGDRTVTINVLTNDTDADNDELTIESISSEPDNGTVTINEDRIITYTPNADFTRGEDTFEYQISDGNGGTDTATVTVTVTPRNTSTLKLTGETAQIAYVAYYGRPADNGGRDFWNNVLSENEVSYAPREGDRLTGQEQDVYDRIVNQFGNSEEADRLFGNIDNNRDKVNRVYQFAFNRDGDSEGLDYWTEQIDNGNVTLATFALEVALGAQNDDIIVLNNKIDSADLFSESIDTQQEIDAYSGSSGEIFGRVWLDDYGDTISSQTQVDSALTDLVNG